MDKPKKCKIVLSKDALQDIKDTKTYILKTFKYREYAENFSKKIKKTIKALDPFAEGYEKTGFIIENRVLKDRMYWQAIINRMKKIDK